MRLDRYAEEVRRSCDILKRRDEISPAQEALMIREVRAAGGLARFVKTLEEDLSPPGDRSSGDVSWEDYSRWGRKLLDRYLVSSGQLPEREQAALEKVRDTLNRVAAAGEVHPSPVLELFKEILAEAMQAPVGRSGVTGQGVFVGPIGSSEGMNFDILHLVGMIEGAVPTHAVDDPLLPDGERQAAGGPAVGLPLQGAGMAEQRYAFLTALASAPAAVLSFPAADPAAQHGHLPSRWFTEQASILEDSLVTTAGLRSLGPRDWLTVMESMEKSLCSEEGSVVPADLHDYDLRWLWRWKKSGGETREHPLASFGILKNSCELGCGRYAGRDFTAWDGNLSSAAAGAQFAARLDQSPQSPTSLERWAGCPFRYFMSHVLGIGSLEEPEEAYSINPLEKGLLVHEILEKFIATVMKEGTMPRPGEGWSSRHRNTLEGIAGANFSEAEAEGRTGRALMWNLDKQNILDDLHGFLEADSSIRQRFGTSPAYLEASFGMGGDSPPAPELELDQHGSLSFRGYIDRVDANEAGGQLLVMDYKTGASAAYTGLGDDPINKGRNLQLAVYSLASRDAFGSGARVRAAYWFVTGSGRFPLLPEEPVDISDADTLERLERGCRGHLLRHQERIVSGKPRSARMGRLQELPPLRVRHLVPFAPGYPVGQEEGPSPPGPLHWIVRGGFAVSAVFVPGDEAERRRIRQSLEESFFVEAGAGTGKTESLVGRVLNLAASGATTLDRVAVITFTEAAAVELRERIRMGLEEWRSAQSPQRRRAQPGRARPCGSRPGGHPNPAQLRRFNPEGASRSKRDCLRFSIPSTLSRATWISRRLGRTGWTGPWMPRIWRSACRWPSPWGLPWSTCARSPQPSMATTICWRPPISPVRPCPRRPPFPGCRKPHPNSSGCASTRKPGLATCSMTMSRGSWARSTDWASRTPALPPPTVDSRGSPSGKAAAGKGTGISTP